MNGNFLIKSINHVSIFDMGSIHEGMVDAKKTPGRARVANILRGDALVFDDGLDFGNFFVG